MGRPSTLVNLMRSHDHYRSFAALSRREREGVDFRREVCDRSSPLVVTAIHGGGVEPGTAELARAIAGADLSLYCFEGIKSRGNRRLHLASTKFDDPLCLGLVSRAVSVLSIHGCEEESSPRVFVSGLAEDMVQRLLVALRQEEFDAVHDGGARGAVQPANICNRGRSGRGVQVEVSRGLREQLFRGLSRRDRRVVLPPFHHFVEVVRSAMLTEHTNDLLV